MERYTELVWGKPATYATLVLSSAIWCLSKLIRYAFPPLFETLQVNYGISNTLMGTVYTGLLTVYALFQFPSGVISERIGPVQVIVGGAVLAAIGSFLLSLDLPFIAVIIAVTLIGAGTGVHKTVTVQVLSKVYPTRTGRVLGIYDTCGAYGGVGASMVVTFFLIAPLSLGIILSPLSGQSWRGVFFFSGITIALLGLLFTWYVPRQLAGTPDPKTRISSPSIGDYARQFARLEFSIFILVTILFAFSYNGVLAFLPLFLVEVSGLKATTANFLYSIVFVVSFVQIFTGDLSDRFGRLLIIVGTLGIAGLALVSTVFYMENSPILLGGLIVLFALGSHGFRPVRGIYLIEILPKRIATGGLGLVRTLLMGSGAIAPMIIGYIADHSDFRIAFAVLATSMISAFGISLGLLVFKQ